MRRGATVLILASLLTVGAVPVLLSAPARATAHAGCAQPFDVLFLFDTTGSMGGVIGSAQAGASSIMSTVAASAPDVQFGVANYKDYPGSYSYPGYFDWYGDTFDYPWQLNQGITADTGAVQTAIDSLYASGGADWPESLTRALWEAEQITWRPGASRLVVLFADAPPHDLDFAGNNFGGDPGPDGIASTADDLDFETVAANLAATGVKVAVVDSGGGSAAAYYGHLASVTGGDYATLEGDFVGQVSSIILSFATSAYVAESYAVDVRLTAPDAGATVDKLNQRLAPPGESGALAADTVTAGPYTLSYGVVRGVASGDADAAQSRGAASARIVDVTLVETATATEVFHADALSASAAATASPAGWTTSSDGTSLAGLRLLGTPLGVAPAPNTVIPLPGGTLTLNEQSALSASTAAALSVRAVHLQLAAAGVGVEIVLSSALAAAACGAPGLVAKPARAGEPVTADAPLPALPVPTGGLDFSALHDPLAPLPPETDTISQSAPGVWLYRQRYESSQPGSSYGTEVTTLSAGPAYVGSSWYGYDSSWGGPGYEYRDGYGSGSVFVCTFVCVQLLRVSSGDFVASSGPNPDYYEETHGVEVATAAGGVAYREDRGHYRYNDVTYYDYEATNAELASPVAYVGAERYQDNVSGASVAFAVVCTPLGCESLAVPP